MKQRLAAGRVSVCMRSAVIIPTYGRPEILGRLLGHLEGQVRAPDAVVISAADIADVPAYRPRNYPLSVLIGSPGSCVQRNRALQEVIHWADIVTFFDDDFLPADRYLARLVECFQIFNDVVAIMGNAAVDGARGIGLSFDEGLMALRALEASLVQGEVPVDQVGTYGCNMSVRASSVGEIRFDERLPLYGWQEDVDFSGRLRRKGRIVYVPDMLGVHLGVKSGRVSGIRFGYPQVVNPVYLIRKGSIPAAFGLNLMVRNVAANVIRSLWAEPFVDRRGRLMGNALAAYHLARGRIEPEYILEL